MEDNPRNGSEERDAADERLRQILEGGGQAPTPAPESGRSTVPLEDDLGESDAASRLRSRADAVREQISAEPRAQPRAASTGVPAGRGRQGLLIIGGVVLIGIVVVLLIVLIAALSGGTPAFSFGATRTPTPTPTETPTPTPIATETPVPTVPAPNLALPPLTCIFQSGVGCYDYCQNAENAAECQSARDFVQAQNADPDQWLNCIAPGPGANVGNPQACLEEAWRALNQ